MTQDKSDKPLLHLFLHTGQLLRERVTNSLGEGGIYFGQARILIALRHHNKLTQGAIGLGLNIKPATVTNQVKRMEASGLIDRRSDANDDRIMNVTLTSKGREAAKFAESVFNRIEDEICSELTQNEISTLRKPLEKVRNTEGGADPKL